jgi:hypothetical protein
LLRSKFSAGYMKINTANEGAIYRKANLNEMSWILKERYIYYPVNYKRN